MNYMNASLYKLSPCALLVCVSALAQTSTPSGMETYSPYTPGQIRELNSQPLSPVEGVFGPVISNSQGFSLSKKPSPDSKLYSQPEGEEEAEALETQSADPYQPISPAISF